MSHRERHRMLESLGARLVRQTNHEIWRSPNGRQIVTASTPSDVRQAKSIMRDVRRVYAGR